MAQESSKMDTIPAGRFRLTNDELRTMFENYGYPPDLSPLERLGGVQKIAKELDTDLDNGIGAHEADTKYIERAEAYGFLLHLFPLSLMVLLGSASIGSPSLLTQAFLKCFGDRSMILRS